MLYIFGYLINLEIWTSRKAGYTLKWNSSHSLSLDFRIMSSSIYTLYTERVEIVFTGDVYEKAHLILPWLWYENSYTWYCDVGGKAYKYSQTQHIGAYQKDS